MLLLKLDEYDLHITVKGCHKIIELLPRGNTEAYFFCLDKTPIKKKTYRKPFFKFWFKGKGYQVAAKRFDDLIRACQAGIAEGSGSPMPTFMIGMRVISAEATGCRVLRFDDDGEGRLEEVG